MIINVETFLKNELLVVLNKTPVENRYCTYCTGKNIEDKMHFVCYCELYEKSTKFFEKSLIFCVIFLISHLNKNLL